MPVATAKIGPEQIAWNIGGRPVTVDWVSASMTAPGGYDKMQGRITGSRQVHRLKQGLRVRGVRPNGKVLFEGLLASQPKISNEVAVIEAEGFVGSIRRRNNRLPYVIADASQWSQMDELPFDYPNNQKYTLQSKGDGLGFMISKDNSYTTGNRAGYGLYVPGHRVQRIRATIRKTGDDANFELEVRDATDLGAASVVGAVTGLGGGTPDGTALNIAAVNDNTVLIDINSNSGGGAVGTQIRVMLQGITACVIADDNNWITSQVVSDVAQRVNFADNVSAGNVQIGGLDWTGGWAELLDYMAAIEDKTWLVEEDRTKGQPVDAMLTFRDWGNKIWRTNLDMATENLTVAPLYNRVTVHFERPAGVEQHKGYEVADFNDLTDPIADGRTYEYPDYPTLENPQRSTNRADQIGEMLLRRVCQLRLVGDIKVAQLLKGHPFDIKAGDKLKVGGFDPDAPPQRIAQVTYNSDGTADCRLERSYDIAAMLYRLSAPKRRKWGSGHHG